MGLRRWLPLLALLLLHRPHLAIAARHLNNNVTLLYTGQQKVCSVNMPDGTETSVIIKDLDEEATVDFYYKDNLICWAETVREKIYCMNHNSTQENEKPKIITSGAIPNGLCIDWYTQNLYWTDKETLRIEVVSLKHYYRKVLFWSDIDQPRAITVAPMEGLLFWTDWGEVAKIERAGMNGDPETRKIIVDKNIFWPNGLTIDYATKKVYWLDAKLNFIDVMDFNGSNRHTIMKGLLEYPFALTTFNSKLYWTDWKTKYIISWDLNVKDSLKNVLKLDAMPGDIRVWDARRQPPPSTPHPCSINNGNCSHLCLLSPKPPGYTCACPTGINLLNKFKCDNGPQSQLILVQKMAISRISLDSPDYTSFELPLRGVKSAVFVDYDSVSEYIYWTDGEACTISRSKIDGTDQSVVIQGDLCNPDGIAIDSIARNMYWVNPVADTITVARLDGSSRKILINEDLQDPRAIAVAPTLGWMFWSDWTKHKIERASLDGSDRIILVEKDINWPNGIALDIKMKKIYWGDAFTHRIEFCNMDGSNRTVLLNENLYHVFGVSLLGDYLYWTDWQRRSLSRVNKRTGKDKETIADQFHSVMGLKTFSAKEDIGTNPCAINNGHCSHFCFNRPTDYICDCPIELEFDKDNKTCVKPNAFIIYAAKDKIGRLSIENSNNNAYLPTKNLKNPSGLAIHAAEGRIYWADSKLKTISRCFVNGSHTEKIIEWTYGIECLALDWCGYNLYWTDSVANRIEVLNLNTSSRRTLIWQGLKRPKSIALDPIRGYMYWSEWGSKTIKRANMDGSYPSILVDQIPQALALNIDYDKKRLIWGNVDSSMIEISNLDGTNRQQLLGKVNMPIAITIYQDNVFWAQWDTDEIKSASMIQKANQTQTWHNISPKLKDITDIVIYHSSLQIGTTPCSFNNGGCSHLCFSMPNKSYKCACPTHYVLNRDNKTCSAPAEFIMFVHRNGIGRVLPGGTDCLDATFNIQVSKSMKAIEYDPLYKHIYWIDGKTHSIRYLQENGDGEKNFLTRGLNISVDFALDAIGRAIYFICTETNTINVTKLDNNTMNFGTVIQGEGIIPRHLVIHQTKRLLFWADKGKSSIMRSNLDGMNVINIIHAPNITALTVDPYSDNIFWANSKQIFAASLNGSSSRIIWQGGSNVMSLAVLRSMIFWIDGAERQLMHLPLNKKDAPARPVLPKSIPLIADVVAVYKLDVKHPCMGGGGCSSVCLADKMCGCVRGLPGSENRCSLPSQCGAHYFVCHPNQSTHTLNLSDKPHLSNCIPISWRCDGVNDCPNASDEMDCDVCPADQFKCSKNKCIADSLVCNGKEDCPDGNDESQCCTGKNYQCPGTSICIHADFVCDGLHHCPGGTDESAAVCAAKRVAVPSQLNSKSSYIFGIIGVVSVLFAVWGMFYCRKRLCSGYHHSSDDKASDPLNTKLSNGQKKITVCPSTSTGPRSSKIKMSDDTHMTTLTRSSLNSYDRNHITGASSSDTNGSSFVGRYPREPLNPPPSPVTTAPSSSAFSRHRPYRHYRVINQPPPPTPCSTDVCDESDCTISYPASGFGFFLEAPPPTPCPPSPPSPSSRSSTYFSPLPPPPSPVPLHYDS